VVLPMPESKVADLVAAIDSASHSIDLEIYQLQDPAIVDALTRAASRLTLRVMIEPKTVGPTNYDSIAKSLTAAGATVQPTPPDFDSSHNVDHAKFMILDGAQLIFGSGNLVRSGLGGNPAGEFDNRDFWVADARKPVVDEASQLFEADFARQSTQSIGFSSLVVTPDNADQSILDLINQSRTRLYVYNQSLSDSAIINALIQAAGRGVDVHVLLGFQPGFGGKPAANQPAIDQLSGHNVSAHFFTRHYLHGKCIVADDRVYIGSQNFTAGGLRNNRELGEILDDASIAEQISKLFLADESNPQP
jgi:phosphatidylserine/phosphatidylglycerophosphate/cardiolipin synthase-like enzyme